LNLHSIMAKYLYLSLAMLFSVGSSTLDVPMVKITNGVLTPVDMPAVGFGTYGYGSCNARDLKNCSGGQVWNNTMIVPLVKEFVKMGGRRIDSALSYKTQEGMGQAIQELIEEKVVTREELFITSKTDIHTPPPQLANDTGYKYHLWQYEQILANAKLEYVDLLLIHWPGAIGLTPETQPMACAEGHPQAGASKGYSLCRSEAWRALVTLLKEKKVRAIGVSNFEEKHLVDTVVDATPGMNQVEFHPFYHEDSLVKYCAEKNIHFQSYSPLGAYDHMTCTGSGCRNWTITPLQHPLVIAISQSHKISAAEVILKWAWQQHRVSTNPRTTNSEHMRQNLESLSGIMLTGSDLTAINAIMGNSPAPGVACSGIFCNNKVCPETKNIP